MRDKEFPIFKTKVAAVTKKFNLNDPLERRAYFDAKAGSDIEKLRTYLSNQTFVAFLIGKKNSGKGTYSKLFMEAVGAEHASHLSVGDIVRDVHENLESPEKKEELTTFLRNNYRGFHSVKETLGLIEERSQSTLISSELILALIKYEISKRPKKAIFTTVSPARSIRSIIRCS